MTRRPDRFPRDEVRRRGSALIVALSVMTPMMIIMGSMMMALASHQKEVEQREGRATAQSLSASGAHHALALLQEDPNFVGTYQIPLPGGAVQVTISDWGVDGIDNDQVDGVDDPNEENILEIVAEGWVNPSFSTGTDPFLKYAAAQTVDPTQSVSLTQTLDPTLDPTLLDPTLEGTYQYPTRPAGDITRQNTYQVSSVRRYSRHSELLVRRIPVDLAVNQTLYVDDPLANLKVSGMSFLFSGLDQNLDGTPAATGIELPGLGTPGDWSMLAGQMSAMQWNNVIGLGGSGAFGTVPAVDLDQMIALMRDQASQIYAHNQKLNSPVMGDVANPTVTWAQGNLSIAGTSSGAGVLIVDGDCNLSGAFEFNGLIICSGSLTVSGGGNKIVRGGAMCLGSVETLGDLVFNGNIEMQYSSEGIDLARQVAKPSLQVLVWMEE